MTGGQIWILFLVVVVLILKLAPGLARRITLLLLGEKGRAQVGRKALAKQPDHITLVSSSRPPGADAAGILQAMGGLGFSPAGSFQVPEKSGLPIHFMVNSTESAVVAVYEHPKVGMWFDLFTRYQDGTSFTFATSRMGGGLDQRPGHPCIRAPGLDPAAAYARFVKERPAQFAKSFLPADVPTMFADAYAESIAWRKQHGISGPEVERVGKEEFRR